MHKLILCVLLVVFQMWMMAVQLDEERSMQLLFELKHGLNRSAHAAAAQVDEASLAAGRWLIDETRAREAALRYLQDNLRLDESNAPLAGSWLREPVELLVFDVINGDQSFPYHYVNAAYPYEATLHHPGVIIMIRARYPRIYLAVGPIVWTVKGTAELYGSS